VRSSDKSPVFNFSHHLLVIVISRIVHVKEKLPPECLRRNHTFSSCNIMKISVIK
jgi:hypothetical protein